MRVQRVLMPGSEAESRVIRQRHGTRLRGFPPWAWDHPVASNWTSGVVRRLSGVIPV